MRTITALALGFVFSMGLAPQLMSAPQFGSIRDRAQSRDRVCVYQDIHYQGWEQCYNAGDEIVSLDRRNNAVSSIRIFGRARVTIYEDTQFRGRSTEFTTSVPDLGLRNLSGSRSWSDHVQSIRITSDYDGRDSRDRDRDRDIPNRQRAGNGVCVYDRRDFQGREECWDTGSEVSDLARAGNWSDRISSIRIFGRAAVVLYRDVNFRGDNVVIDQDTDDLSRVTGNGFRSWDRQASSLAVETDRGRGRGRGRLSRF